MRFLIIDDDVAVLELVVHSLKKAGHMADQGADAAEGLRLAEADGYDAIVLDPALLGGTSGLAVLPQIRELGDVTPVLLLSEKQAVSDRVAGLRGGADDYLTKPFAMPELLARLEALTRRTRTRLRVADLEIDRLSRIVTRRGQVIELQPREFTLLEAMVRHTGQVMTRAALLHEVWHTDEAPTTNIVDVHVSRLRQKVDQPFEPKLIHTVRGDGYVLKAGGAQPDPVSAPP